MKDVLDLKESLEDARIFQDFGIEPAFSIYDGGGIKKLMEISSIREKYFPKSLGKDILLLNGNEFPLYYKNNKGINEGLIETYPIQPIINELIEKTGLKENRFHCSLVDKDSGIAEIVKVIIFVIEETENLLKTIKTTMEKGGYFSGGKQEFRVGNYVGHQYFFRPKFPKTTINDLPRYLYHITDAYSARKIKKNGFYPRNKNERGYIYPDRVHFFTTYNIERMVQYALLALKGVRVGKKEKRPIYTIFQIDTAKIPNVTFYKDFDFDPNSTEGIFTYSYITPEAISKEQTIDLEQMLLK